MAEKQTLLSKPWQKFINKMAEFSTIQAEQWEPAHTLGYFAYRFQKHFNHKYALSFQGPPSKCSEIVLIKKIYGALDTTFAPEVKAYIDWVFDMRIIPNKLAVRSVSFMLAKGIMNDFLKIQAEKKRITKSTPLPEEFKSFIDFYEIPASTYGDLQFIKNALDQDSESESRQPYKKLLEQLSTIGLKLDILDKLK
jgi:hypothetical protein